MLRRSNFFIFDFARSSKDWSSLYTSNVFKFGAELMIGRKVSRSRLNESQKRVKISSDGMLPTTSLLNFPVKTVKCKSLNFSILMIASISSESKAGPPITNFSNRVWIRRSCSMPDVRQCSTIDKNSSWLTNLADNSIQSSIRLSLQVSWSFFKELLAVKMLLIELKVLDSISSDDRLRRSEAFSFKTVIIGSFGTM